MKKSGLHKQITSIFNETPESQPQAKMPDVKSSAMVVPGFMVMEQTSQADASAAQKPEQPPAAVASSAASAGRSVRPMPVPKNSVAAAIQPHPSRMAGLRTAVMGQAANPRQTKMVICAGALSIVFVTVLFISLGGVGSSNLKKQDPASTNKTTKATAQAGENTLVWKAPEPLSATIRDPMQPGAVPLEASGEGPAVVTSGEWVVKGIVFSSSRPSALVNNEIVKEGEVVNGATIVRIGKSEVEFELNGKRWTQPVQK